MWRDQARDAHFDLVSLRKIGTHESRGALDNTEPAEELTLCERAVDRKADFLALPLEGRKIDLRSQVRFPRRAQGMLGNVMPHGLKGFAGRRFHMAVIDEQRSHGGVARAAGQILDHRNEALAFADDGFFSARYTLAFQSLPAQGLEHQSVLIVHTDDPRAPDICLKNLLHHGERIEELGPLARV